MERRKSPLCADKIYPSHLRSNVDVDVGDFLPDMTRETSSTTLLWTCEALLYILAVVITLSNVSFGLRAYAM
ncbi:hypothetical protein PAXINDRAFT_172408 [Paxillus involutus ATCC 200175]|uniref:Uncharacterized protein n=1 Tax=Paxillus involutus ATCC 200175 TaxID=664439 RepID=A0A0C9TPN6_PAXIN|nr:hypothetical protein PAXINDRAFT_172408 [Paxillus involutus ATCC 200175]